MAARVVKRRLAGEDYAVVQIVGGNRGALRAPCAQCPWRKDVPAGVFPAEAFRISAPTAYDAAMDLFACHMAGQEKPATCAGFLLANSANNIGARLAAMRGDLDYSKLNSPFPLYGSYREMAEANGVAPDDPVLARCRADDE